jgi:hypothetical protein
LNRHLVDAKLLGSHGVMILNNIFFDVFLDVFFDTGRRFGTFTHNGHGTVLTAGNEIWEEICNRFMISKRP